jgi:hypothetical protein
MAGSIQIKRMGWIRMPTAWEQTMQWKEKQARVKERMEKLSADASGLSSAAQNHIQQSGALAVQAAIDRNAAAAKARAAALAKQQAEAKWDELI